MRIGVPTEVKNHEYRVALTPAGAHEMARRGHETFVQAGAGAGSSIPDDEYRQAGATILDTADEVWASADLVLKVKEPIKEEWHRMREGQLLFTYLHLAADSACAQAIMESGTTAIAYETVQLADGTLPLLAPMSEVAGKLAAQVGFSHLLRSAGGRGVLPGGVPGVQPADVVVIGGGVSGVSAAEVAVGMGARVDILDLSVPRLRQIDARFGGRLGTIASNSYAIDLAVTNADLVIGAVLVPGAKAPKLISDELVARMRPGSVLVDIAIDQGGCFQSSRPTTHADPTFQVHGSTFYCVANMPGAVPRTSTYALTNVTLPYATALADRGWRQALATDPALALGLNVHDGRLYNSSVADALDTESSDVLSIVAA